MELPLALMSAAALLACGNESAPPASTDACVLQNGVYTCPGGFTSPDCRTLQVPTFGSPCDPDASTSCTECPQGAAITCGCMSANPGGSPATTWNCIGDGVACR